MSMVTIRLMELDQMRRVVLCCPCKGRRTTDTLPSKREDVSVIAEL
jgi:hypothetical protein